MLANSTAPTNVTLSVDASGLVPGTPYGGDVVISSSVGDIIIPIELTLLQGPVLALSADTLTFYSVFGKSSSQTQTITVSNEAAGVLSGLTATWGGESWLVASLDSDTAKAQLSVTVDTATLELGIHTATIQVSSPVASNSPQALTIIADIREP